MFSNSLRTLELNDSMKALSVGFPGREKSSSMRLLYAHWSSLGGQLKSHSWGHFKTAHYPV